MDAFLDAGFGSERVSLVKGYLVVLGEGKKEIFEGKWIGAERNAPISGEVVFNTSMTGYQEILTDPSYAGQIIAFTSAHIGNTGVNSEDFESNQIHARGVLISNEYSGHSHHQAEATLDEFLKKNNVSGLSGVDTRALTLYLRERGVVSGYLVTESDFKKEKIPEFESATHDWIMDVTTKEPYWLKSTSALAAKFKVVAYDFGVKAQLLRELRSRGCDVWVVPADYPAENILQKMKTENWNGVFLSNGPGDPSVAKYAVKNVKELLGNIPIFGVCMGHQILSLALGAKTYKLKYGHRGGNQPVKNLISNSVEISSHNHGYAVDPSTLPSVARVSHTNLNDQCCEGIEVPSKNAFSVQYHPESSPGPHDSSYLFDRFIEMMSV
jgi:carbamoyl-phosphate synthase small subunit